MYCRAIHAVCVRLSHLSLLKPADSSSTERHLLGQYNFKQYWYGMTGVFEGVRELLSHDASSFSIALALRIVRPVNTAGTMSNS